MLGPVFLFRSICCSLLSSSSSSIRPIRALEEIIKMAGASSVIPSLFFKHLLCKTGLHDFIIVIILVSEKKREREGEGKSEGERKRERERGRRDREKEGGRSYTVVYIIALYLFLLYPNISLIADE